LKIIVFIPEIEVDTLLAEKIIPARQPANQKAQTATPRGLRYGVSVGNRPIHSGS
jgi:hypothetical protein